MPLQTFSVDLHSHIIETIHDLFFSHANNIQNEVAKNSLDGLMQNFCTGIHNPKSMNPTDSHAPTFPLAPPWGWYIFKWKILTTIGWMSWNLPQIFKDPSGWVLDFGAVTPAGQSFHSFRGISTFT